MHQQPRRFRLRLSTLMLLVVIVWLAVALVIEQRKRRQVEEELAVTRSQFPRYATYRARLVPRKTVKLALGLNQSP